MEMFWSRLYAEKEILSDGYWNMSGDQINSF